VNHRWASDGSSTLRRSRPNVNVNEVWSEERTCSSTPLPAAWRRVRHLLLATHQCIRGRRNSRGSRSILRSARRLAVRSMRSSSSGPTRSTVISRLFCRPAQQRLDAGNEAPTVANGLGEVVVAALRAIRAPGRRPRRAHSKPGTGVGGNAPRARQGASMMVRTVHARQAGDQ